MVARQLWAHGAIGRDQPSNRNTLSPAGEADEDVIARRFAVYGVTKILCRWLWLRCCGHLLQAADTHCYGGVVMSAELSHLETASNPFTPDFGRRPAMMAGRGSLLNSATRSLRAGPSDRGFTRLLLGQRGSGKTTLLAEVRDVAASSGMLVVEVDAATAGLPQRIESAIADARERHEILSQRGSERRVSGVQIGPVAVSWESMPQRRSRWSLGYHLERLASWSAEHGSAILLTVDEMHAGDRNELRRLAADVQSITKVKELPLSLIAAGLPEMSYTVLEDKKMTFFHRCHRDQMPDISTDEAWSCINTTIKDAGGTVETDALMAMADAVSGLPYALQTIGHHAWELSSAPTRTIDMAAATAAVELAGRDLTEQVITPMWHDVLGTDQEVLKALAAHGGEATPREIAKTMPTTSARSLARSLGRLVSAGHACRSAHGTVQHSGTLTAAAVRRFAVAESEFDIEVPRGAGSVPVFSQAKRCGAYMPRAKARCVLTKNHRGYHRSKL